MSTLRFSCALVLMLTGTAANAAAQTYAQQGYDQQQPQYSEQQYQQQYPQQQQYQQGQGQGQQYQQYPQQQNQQQPPPGYFPTPDAQGAYNYQQQVAPGAYPAGQGADGGPPLVSSVAGAFQIGAGISLIEYNSLSMNQDMMAVTTTPGMMMTPPAMGAVTVPTAPVNPVVTTIGVVKHPVYLELGYGVAPNMVVGALAAVSNTSETVNNGAIPAKDFVVQFAPKFDYHFSPTSRLNPFIGGALSINYENKTYIGLRDSRMLFGLQVRGGLRYFVLDGLSIDPTASLGGSFGSGKQENLTQTPNSKSEYSASAIHFAISVGVSAWIK